MVNNLSKLLENKVTFIIGSEKNVGKTTFFNLARGAIKGTRHLLATIGVDGEKQDLVHGNTKPQILVDTDEYVVTTDSMLNSSDAELELVEIFPFKTVLGRMSIARVLRQGTLELVGPGSNEQLSHILEYAKNELNINTMLIDGAINRITQISSSSKTSLAKASFIYVLTVTQNNINSSIDKMKLIYELSKCQDDNNGKVMSADHYYLPGALTTDKLSSIPEDISSLLLEDFTKVFIPYNSLVKLSAKTKIFFKQSYEFLFFVVNLVDIDTNSFNKMTGKDIAEKIVYNPFVV